MPWTRLIFVRHGHTAANAQGLHAPMSGSTDVPLGARGVREARAIAERLALEADLAAIYSSALSRAQVTARAIAERCGMELRLEPELAEIDCGEADGLSLGEVRARYPDHWRRNLEQRDPDFRWPGGESYREFRARASSAVRRIALAHPGERVVVVTHAGVISQLIGSVRGVSAACWERFRPRTGSWTELSWASDALLVERFDELPRPSEEAAPVGRELKRGLVGLYRRDE